MQELHRLSIGGARGRPRYKHVTQLRDCGWSFLGSDLTGSLETQLVALEFSRLCPREVALSEPYEHWLPSNSSGYTRRETGWVRTS